MTDHVYLNADKTALVPEHADGKKYQISRDEAVKLGLLETAEKPNQTRRNPNQKRRKTE